MPKEQLTTHTITPNTNQILMMDYNKNDSTHFEFDVVDIDAGADVDVDDL